MNNNDLILETPAEADSEGRYDVATGSAPFPFLAHRNGIGLMLGILVHQGAMCSKCGHGTRATSKRWSVCKKCGQRTERRSLPNAT